ncbi:hypothetical protein WG66_016540 [Moniliophthora roreri]|nr:hypothetical protein WG66_016540 [Moniliophthora roreri]
MDQLYANFSCRPEILTPERSRSRNWNLFNTLEADFIPVLIVLCWPEEQHIPFAIAAIPSNASKVDSDRLSSIALTFFSMSGFTTDLHLMTGFFYWSDGRMVSMPRSSITLDERVFMVGVTTPFRMKSSHLYRTKSTTRSKDYHSFHGEFGEAADATTKLLVLHISAAPIPLVHALESQDIGMNEGRSLAQVVGCKRVSINIRI